MLDMSFYSIMLCSQTCILAFAFALKLYFNTCCRLTFEVWMIHETSLGWTRYTPRLIYLCCHVTI
ncbi:hypothetical protein Hdeb2414_s0010g00329001 [Helianthus debilis subsp. tardiflorus]